MATNHETTGSSFRGKLLVSFSGSAVILLLAGSFALYLMAQLSTAIEQMVGNILPKTLVAMRLSEHSALLVAYAPSLTNARDREEMGRIEANLDELQREIDSNVSILEGFSNSSRLEKIRKHITVLLDSLATLKNATNDRFSLEAQHRLALVSIRAAHNELVDTISPVVWGVSSLTRLLGKRTARKNENDIKKLRNDSVALLIALEQLQTAHNEHTNSLFTGARPAIQAADSKRYQAWELAQEQLSKELTHPDPIYQRLREKGERLFAAPWQHHDSTIVPANSEFISLLMHAKEQAQQDLNRQFQTTIKTSGDRMAIFVDRVVRDMGYASDIKAEGNLLFALLTAASEADSRTSLSSLQERFRRSYITFQQSALDFQQSSLSLRNPILAQNVIEIEKRLSSLGKSPKSLFDIRRAQLEAGRRIEKLLTRNRLVAAQLKNDVRSLVEEVQAETDKLNAQMEQSGGANLLLLILAFLAGLFLLGVIAWFSVRIQQKQEQEIRQAATVFETAGEGIIISDPHSKIIAINNAFSRISGYQSNEIVGQHIKILRSNRHDSTFYKTIGRVLSEEGRWQGEIYTHRKNGQQHLDWLTINVVRDNQGQVIQYVSVFSDVAIVKRSLEQLDHLAHHDTLTGLPNRLLLHDRLDHAIRRAFREKRNLAVLFLDLDRFKIINDTLGHTAGDELLRLTSKRLSDQVREGDTVARLGGDEFMILLEDCHSPNDARTVAQKVLNSFEEVFTIHGHELFITSSIGISVYPGDGTNVDELIKNADAAMYRAKEEGKDNYQFYTSDLTVIAKEKLQLESLLRLALARDQFELHYQPKWNTHSGDITGVEALLRWRHPEHGLVGPAGILPTLEDCGLILPLGKWILQTACKQAQTWQQQGLPPMQMSVNISGHQITQGSLLDSVAESLAESGLDPSYLELEIIEDLVMQQPEEVIALLKSLRDMGISIAIDDFGTGYSSLSYLKQLPIQKLKIDRSFVRDIPDNPDDVAITSAIIALGLRLQLSIVAEGVETEAQLAFLKHEGCTEAQGYLFSRPLPKDEMAALLRYSHAKRLERSALGG